MSSFLLDTYTDTAGTALESHVVDSGGPATKITSLTGSAQITSAGRLRAATAATLCAYAYASPPGPADYDVICDVYLASLTTDASMAGPLGRVSNSSQTYYWGRLVNDPARSGGAFTGFDIYKNVAGTSTLIAQSASTAFTAGSTFRLKLSMRGSALTLYTSTDAGATFTSVCSITDASIAGPGQAGVCFFAQTAPTDSTGLQIDNLSATSTLTIAPDNPAWFSSPGNWILSPSVAISTDFGAKRSIVVSGSANASLTFDLSALSSASVAAGDYPQIRFCVDGGVAFDLAVSPSVSLFSGLGTGPHEIVYEYLRGSLNYDGYNTPVMALRETGLQLAIAGSASVPTDLQTDLMFVSGDSITAGEVMLSSASPGGGDGTASFAKSLSLALGAEVGPAGKGAVGWAWAGLANVPVFTTEWKYAWNAQLRSFPALKRLITVIGTNDAINNVSDSVVSAAVVSWIADARSVLGFSTWIHIVVPFGGFKRSALAAGVASYLASHPGEKTDLLDLGISIEQGLAGPYGTPTRQAPIDGIHPTMVVHGQLAAALAVAIRSAESTTASTTITASAPGTTHTVGGGVFAGL